MAGDNLDMFVRIYKNNISEDDITRYCNWLDEVKYKILMRKFEPKPGGIYFRLRANSSSKTSPERSGGEN